MAFIKVKNLKKNYYVTREEKQEVLKGIDVEFEHGEFVALLGESGCGKTTFLNILAGLDFDYTGSVVVNGSFHSDFSEKDFDQYRKKRVGIIFQSFNLIKQMTAFENVMVPLNLTQLSSDERKERAEELLKMVGLEGHMNKLPSQMSGGQKQRVAIARALANNPSAILADEPTGNLDAESADGIMELLKNIAMSGKLVICVTHSSKVAENCTRVLKMEDGKIASDNSIKHYKTRRNEQEKPIKIKDNIDKKELFTFAKNNIKSSFKRSLLVSIALSIGICSFVMMLFLGDGLTRYVENSMDTSMNKLQINVQKSNLGAFTSTELGYFEEKIIGANTYDPLINGVSEVYKAYAISDLQAEYKYDESSYNRLLYVATTYEGFKINLIYGRVPSPDADGEVLISSAIARRLINSEIDEEIDWSNATSITLRYNGADEKTYTVVGVFENDSYDTAYISKNIIQDFTGTTVDAAPNLLYVIAKNVASIGAVIEDVELLMPSAVVTRMDTSAEDLLSYINIGSLMLSMVSIVALIVSAIMIFIVMYISVIERTKEIGILRALGTRRRDIKRIFIIEGGIIGFTAGVFGCVFAIVIGVVANIATSAVAQGGIMSINPIYLLLGVGISFILSIISSFGPSSSGAELDPIEALRSE